MPYTKHSGIAILLRKTFPTTVSHNGKYARSDLYDLSWRVSEIAKIYRYAMLYAAIVAVARVAIVLGWSRYWGVIENDEG